MKKKHGQNNEKRTGWKFKKYKGRMRSVREKGKDKEVERNAKYKNLKGVHEGLKNKDSWYEAVLPSFIFPRFDVKI